MLTDTGKKTNPQTPKANHKDMTINHKNLIYDVGVHRGQDTDFYLRKGFKVIAFEANPANIEFCKKRFAAEIEEQRLVIIEGAIVETSDSASEEQKAVFYRNKDHSFWGSADRSLAYRNEVLGTTNETIEVNAVNFRHCLKKYGVPHYLKVDIVGSETICLRALLDFEERPDYISINSEKVIFRRLEEEIELFDRLGYNKFKAIQQDFSHLEAELALPGGKKIDYKFEEGASGLFGEETEGKWKTREQILKRYRKIFTLYWLFGDYSFLTQTKKGKIFVAQLERVLRRSLPGWYDTHARHSSLELKSKLLAFVSVLYPILEVL